MASLVIKEKEGQSRLKIINSKETEQTDKCSQSFTVVKKLVDQQCWK
jgi:hypothetical protein